MYKVKIKCGTCDKSTYEREDGRTVTTYALVSTKALAATQPKVTECRACGDIRREAEEAKKQARLERLMVEE